MAGNVHKAQDELEPATVTSVYSIRLNTTGPVPQLDHNLSVFSSIARQISLFLSFSCFLLHSTLFQQRQTTPYCCNNAAVSSGEPSHRPSSSEQLHRPRGRKRGRTVAAAVPIPRKPSPLAKLLESYVSLRRPSHRRLWNSNASSSEG